MSFSNFQLNYLVPTQRKRFLIWIEIAMVSGAESWPNRDKRITKKYITGLKVKVHAVLDKFGLKETSDEANCLHELLLLSEQFEKSAERWTIIEKEKSAEITKLLAKNAYTDKNLSALKNKFLLVEASKTDFQEKLQDALNSVDSLEKDRSWLLRTIEENKILLRVINRDRDVSNNTVKKLEKQLSEKNYSIKESAQVLETHKNEIKTIKNSLLKRSNELFDLQKERDRCTHEIELYVNKMEKKDKELMEVTDLLSKLKASQDTCRLQSIDKSRKLDAFVSETIVLRRDIKIMTQNRDEIQNNLRKMNIERDSLRENISRMEISLHEAQKQIEQFKRTNKILKADLERWIAVNEKLNSSLQQKLLEIVDLNNAITLCEKSIVKLNGQVKKRKNEKDFVGTQIIRRNDEIALLTEKLEVTQLALDRGESQYNDRLEDISRLTIELKNLRANIYVLKENALKMKNWKNQIAILQRELEIKKYENVRLLNELQTPVNVHRWRLLSGEDPDRMRLVQKYGIHQNRILNQTSLIADKENQLVTANKSLNSFKISLCDSQLSAVKLKLIKTRRTLCRTTKRLKSLEAECRSCNLEIHGK